MVSAVKYPFSRKWQRRLLSLLIIDGSQIIHERLIRAEYFESPTYVDLATVVLRMYEEYGVPLTFSAVKQRIRKDITNLESKRRIYKLLKKLQKPIPEIEIKVIADQVKRFIQHQTYKNVLRKSVDLLEKDDLDSLEKQWMAAISVGKGQSVGTERWYFSSLAERRKLSFQKSEILPTCIHGLDKWLQGGGFSRSELNVFLGEPGIGKSFSLDHLAKVSVIQKKKVVFYSLEMGWQKVAARLDAAFSGVEIRELRDKGTKVKEKLEAFEARYGDSLLIREYPAQSVTVPMLRAHIMQLRLKGFNPDVIIVDYINLLGRAEKTDSYRGLGDVYIALRGLMQEFNVWGITAAQSHRSRFNSELITMKDIAESFEGAMHSDTIITLNETDAEHQKGRMRLYLAKNRNEVSGRIIPIQTDFARGSFYTRRKVKVKQ